MTWFTTSTKEDRSSLQACNVQGGFLWQHHHQQQQRCQWIVFTSGSKGNTGFHCGHVKQSFKVPYFCGKAGKILSAFAWLNAWFLRELQVWADTRQPLSQRKVRGGFSAGSINKPDSWKTEILSKCHRLAQLCFETFTAVPWKTTLY